MSIHDVIDAQRRMAAIERETDFYGTKDVARSINAANSHYNLHSTVTRIQEQINPATGIANALRESAMFANSGVREVQQGIADVAREALRHREAERGIAEVVRLTDPFIGIRNALQAAQEESRRFVAAANAMTAANLLKLQQPLVDLNQYLRVIHDQIATPYVVQVSAIQNAVQGISRIFEFATPGISADDLDESEESRISDEQLAALFATAFPASESPLNEVAFDRGVQTIVTAIEKVKDSRLQKIMAQYAVPFLIFLLTMFWQGQKTREELPPIDRSGKAPATPRPAAEHQNFAVVTADILNLRQSNSSRSRIVGKLRKGERVRIMRKQGKWTEVETGRACGWVVTAYLRPEKA